MTPLAVSICSPVLLQLFMYVRVWLMSFTELQITEKQWYLIPFASLHLADGPGTQPQSHVSSWKNLNGADASQRKGFQSCCSNRMERKHDFNFWDFICMLTYAASIEHGRIHIESHCSPSLVTLPLFLCCICYSSGLGFAWITRCPASFGPHLTSGCWGQLLSFSSALHHTAPSFEHLKSIKSKVNVVFMLSFGAGKYKIWAPGMVYFLFLLAIKVSWCEQVAQRHRID